tara:strand:- start:113 stop:928 length:816 start_codon:yes stop_codon:yes gene_type:complete
MSGVIKGYKGVVQNGVRISYSQNDGWESEITYEGPKANIFAIAGNVKQWADDFTINAGAGPTATLVAKVGRDIYGSADNAAVDVVTTWDLNSNEVQRDLREVAGADTLSDDKIKEVEKAANDAKASDNAASSFPAGGRSSWGAAEKNLFWFFMRDQFNWMDFEFALTKRELVTSYYTVGVSMAGINKLWTTAQINATEGAFPNAMAASVTAIFANSTPTKNNTNMADETSKWYYRWLKKAPQITQTAGGKFERTTEWWLGLWPTWIYPAYT